MSNTTTDQRDREWTAAWLEIANACERGLAGLSPQHPRRDELEDLHDDARRAAGLTPLHAEPSGAVTA